MFEWLRFTFLIFCSLFICFEISYFLNYCFITLKLNNLKQQFFQGDDKPLGGGGELKPLHGAIRTSLIRLVGLQSPSP
jgi:hypothetical protein